MQKFEVGTEVALLVALRKLSSFRFEMFAREINYGTMLFSVPDRSIPRRRYSLPALALTSTVNFWVPFRNGIRLPLSIIPRKSEKSKKRSNGYFTTRNQNNLTVISKLPHSERS